MIYDCPFYSLIGRYRLAIDQLLSKFGTFSHKYRCSIELIGAS